MEQKVVLVKNKTDLKDKISNQIQIGEEFIARIVTTKEDQNEWWDTFIDWDFFNIEIIKQAFDKPNNSYVDEYKRSDAIGWIDLNGSYKEPTLQDSIESCRDEIKGQVRSLKLFYKKIDLFKTDNNFVKLERNELKVDQLINLLSKFHKVAQELRDRRQGRETVIIKDEYDVQDLLNALLYLHFDDVRKEDFSPSNAGANSRIDFVLKNEKIIIEVKMSTERLREKQLGEELLVDIGRYKAYPNCSTLVIFIYDKSDYVRNKKGLISDLEKHSSEKLKVRVVITPD